MDLYNLVVSAKLTKGGGGGDIDVDELSVTENGTYTASSGHAYSPVTVDVPNSYDASDEGKVVSNGALVGQTSATKTANGTYDTTLNNEIVVNVPGPSGTISITQNGTVDVTQYASANVNVSGGGGGSADLAAYIDGSIETLTTPSSITSISDQSIYARPNLRELIVSEGVVDVGSYCGYMCPALELVDLPSTVQSIGTGFTGYYNIAVADVTIYCRAVNPPVLNNAFNRRSTSEITAVYVPAESVEAYKAASGWSALGGRIRAIPE